MIKHFEAWRSKMKTEAVGYFYDFCYFHCCSGFILKLIYNLRSLFLDSPGIVQVQV